MLERVAGLVTRDRRIDGLGFALVAVLRIGPRVEFIAVIGIDHMTGAATRGPEITGVVVGAQEPHQRIVEAGLGEVENRYRDTNTGAWTAARLFDVELARFLQALDDADQVGQADLGEQIEDIATATFENTEDIAGGDGFPGRQWDQSLNDTGSFELVGNFAGTYDRGGLALTGVSLT